jgi:hypothetical protein
VYRTVGKSTTGFEKSSLSSLQRDLWELTTSGYETFTRRPSTLKGQYVKIPASCALMGHSAALFKVLLAFYKNVNCI